MLYGRHVLNLLLLSVLSVALFGSCADKKDADPGDTVLRILDLHDLAGKQLEDRSKESRDKEVNREKLSALIADLDQHDPFIADIYLGFVLGVLSSHQTRLFVTTEGTRAEVMAGKAVIGMRLVDGTWRIVLGESVPAEIMERALPEKKTYEDAKARAAAGVK